MAKKRTKKQSKKNNNQVKNAINDNKNDQKNVQEETLKDNDQKDLQKNASRYDDNTEDIEDIEKEENDNPKIMDFSKIDDEYKGELRRKLTPKERFFRTCEKFGDLFLLNVFFTLTSLPIVTIGASFTAMYSVTFKMVRNEDIPVKDGYFKAFKKNFKQSTQLWVVLMVIFYLVYRQFKYIFSTDAKAADYVVMVLGLELLVLTFTVPLLFPFVARYENTNFNMIKNSILASFLHLGTWATVFFLWVIPAVLYYLKETWFIYTWYLWLVFLSAFVAYTCSYRLRRMFDILEGET